MPPIYPKLIWKLDISSLVFNCFIIAGTGYLGAMGNQKWTELDGDSRSKLILGLAISVAVTVKAYLQKVGKQLVTGNDIPPDFTEDTTIITAASTTQTNQTSIKTNEK
jgi:hypothetical protein